MEGNEKNEEVKVEVEEVKNEEVKTEEVKTENVKAGKAEELKDETKNTVNQVKEKMKEVDFKEDAKATKGFVKEMIKNPLERIKEIAEDSTNKHFKIAILLVIAWCVLELVGSISFSSYAWYNVGKELMYLLKVLVAPLFVVAGTSLVIFFLNNKENKKSLVTVITTVTTAKIPLILSSVISLLTLISSNATVLTNRVYYFARAISLVLMFFAVKDLFGKKEDKDALKTFVIVEAIFYVVSLLVSFLGIGIY